MPKSPRVWIVDGHNVIFQLPQLEKLQAAGRRREARKGLESMMSALAARVGERFIVVYDGNRMERNPDVIREEGLQTVYSLPPEEADDRIVYLCQELMKGGHRVRVVTSDLRTLGRNLPPGVSLLTADDLRRRFLSARGPEEKPVRGDFSDIEAEMLRRAAQSPPPEIPRPAPSRPAPRKPPRAEPPPAPAANETSAEVDHLRMPPMDDEARAALQRKKDRGRRRQERRLGKRSKGGRR
jgi:predicted RNA-binding protein with PIN domain